MSAKAIKKIAIYGKGGIGKSTTTSNLSAALSVLGYKVLQVGCDPKSDSTVTLRSGEYIPTILEILKNKNTPKLHEIVYTGFNNVYCVEAGGPAPGVGCAGRGIITSVELLKQLRAFEELDLDYVIFDVLGDVVCGGFAVPIREGIADHVFTVSSSDFMAVYAANNLFTGIRKYSNQNGALLGGIIANSVNQPYSKDIIDDFAERTGTKIMEYVPRSLTVTQSELQGQTTLEAFPESAQAQVYLNLAGKVAQHQESKIPQPLEVEELRKWASDWSEKLLELEKGTVQSTGASI
ncbi:AAA family ATPase [Seleniivibrio woodruffii]|uniref:Nitrogenase iron protein n=1 Tax=Seleniivibrio woodruffii TaxID=1078050 RepID=A0A4R1KAD9_9BACT|nr:nitrogenase iron protein NifH [Seleniivibrio woodruffii]TCK61000.1 nitrogenase iron protein NifH [Seleniivibrio woodruffii]TVZ36630.1 nitrogenase iron protein NifH [Seleniivibrio woodruffii]